MKIILKQSVDNLGGEGEILEVKAGYGRNYLIPKGWAKQATKVNIAATEKEIDARLKKEAKTRDNLEALGKLFGSVTSQMIVDGIAEKGYTVNKKEIEIEESINHVGKYFVDVKLGHGFSGRVKLKVTAEK